VRDLTDSLLTNVVIYLCGLMILWYFAGTALNRRRATELFRALQHARPELGERFGQLMGRPNQSLKTQVAQPRTPYARVTVHFVLEAREILFLWLINHYVRGKRDQMVVHIELLTPPSHSLLLADPETQLGRLAVEKAREGGHITEAVPVRGDLTLQRWGESKAEERLAADFARTGIRPGLPLWVLRTQRTSPQVLLICGLERADSDELTQLFRRLRQLAVDTVKGNGIKGGKAVRAREPKQPGGGSGTPKPAAEPDEPQSPASK
jgi:hypothetical protein